MTSSGDSAPPHTGGLASSSGPVDQSQPTLPAAMDSGAAAAPPPSESLFEAIFETSAVGIVIVDSTGCLLRANRAFAEMLGYQQSELVGKRVREITHPDYVQASVNHIRELATGRHERRQIETRYLHRNGGSVWARLSVALLRGQPDSSKLAVVTVEDISERKKAEDALRASEAKYRTIFDSVNDAIAIFDPDTRMLLEVNQKAVDLSGFDNEEMRQLKVDAISADPTQFTEQDLLLRMIQAAAERPQIFEWLARNRDGTFGWVEVNLRQAEFDGVHRMVAVVREIGDRKQVEVERARLAAEIELRAAELDATISSMADGVVICGPAGEILRMNRAARELLGVDWCQEGMAFDELLLRHQDASLDAESDTQMDAPIASALEGVCCAGLVLALDRRELGLAWISLSAAPIKTVDGKMLGAVATITDVSAVRTLQQQQEDLLRAVSHDLRAPLTVIQGLAQMISSGLARSTRYRRARASAETIVLAARRMNSMIQDLIDSVRMESGQLHLRLSAVDVRDAVIQIKYRLDGALDMRRVRLDAEEDCPPALADPDRLDRILANLISNALKYSAQGSEVSVAVRHEVDDVVVSVSDRGNGMTPEDLSLLFQKFGRPAYTGEQRDSVGLGLYITRGLVEAQGGRIWVESEVGVGSTFSFSLPVFREDQAPF